MLSKKQLGPVNCASCDKNLVNICGNPADFSPHKRMPYRETSERIARYGQGFSKMLSTIQPQLYEQTIHGQSVRNINQSVNKTQNHHHNRSIGGHLGSDKPSPTRNAQFGGHVGALSSSNPALLPTYQQ